MNGLLNWDIMQNIRMILHIDIYKQINHEKKL